MMPGNTTTTAGSTCILCANNGVSFALHQQEQIVFFAKLLKNTLHPEAQNDLDIGSVISLVPSLYVFCSNCYNKVLRAKESFDALTRLQRTLRQAQVEVQAQILSSYYASISNRSSSDYIDKVRSDLVQRLIFNLATTADEVVRPAHYDVPELVPSSIFADEDFFQFEDDDVHFPLSDPITVNQEENTQKFMVPTSSSSSSLLVSEATHSRDRQAKRSSASARIQKNTAEDSNEKKPATGGYKMKKCTVSLGPRVIPLKCVNAECGETFWTDVLLRRHLKLHRVREQCHSDDRGIRIVTVKRQQRLTRSRRVVRVPTGRCTIRKPRKVRSERKRGSTSALMTLFDKSNTVSYPTKCPLENCFSSRTFENRDYLRTHINRMHWDLDPNPPKKPPGHVTQVEIDVMTSLHSRTLPSQCPLDDCWLNETYDTLRALQGHVRQHLHVMKMHQEEQPAEMRRELYAAHYLDYPAYCYAESCHYRSKRPFGNKEVYKRHIRDVHYKVRTSRNLFNFDKQNKLFHELQAHYRSLQELTFPAKCFIEGCEDETCFGREYDLRLHIKTIHYDNVQEKAGRPDEKHFNMLQMLDNIESYPAKCPMENCASKDFNSRTSMRQHLQLVHIGDTFVNFSTSEETSMDVQVGDDSSKNSLDVDKEIQDAEEQEKNETSSALGQQPTSSKVAEYNCDKCFRVYHTYVSLRHHQVQSHKEKMIRNHKCEHCGKVFASPSSYKNHIHIRHSGAPATFLCSFCPKTFKIESYLKLHLRRHTGEYKFFCGCCPSGFLLRSELEDHERGQHWKELGIEPIKCDICGRFFTRGGILNAHRKLHSEAAFCCTECDYKTGFRNDLAEHVATVHRTETPFQCQTCGKAFKLARRLRQHMRSHVIEYPHICVPCNKPYASARQLRVHNERKHGAVPSTAPRGILVEGL